MPWADEDRVRATAQGLGAAHRGLDPEASRRVVRRRDDAPAVRVAADDQRHASQVRLLELFHGCEEGVEVEVREDHPRKATDRA